MTLDPNASARMVPTAGPDLETQSSCCHAAGPSRH